MVICTNLSVSSVEPHAILEHSSTGAVMIRIGYWGLLNYNDNKEPPKWYWELFRPLD